METFELILFLLIAVVASSILDKLLPRLSLPLVQIALGAFAAMLVATPLQSGIDPELLLILFIAPLHFNESRHADSGALWRNRWGIASLAIGLVMVIVIAVGFTLHTMLPAIPLAIACSMGAAMGSTDAPAVTALSKDFRFGKRHETLLQGEALFNDVTGTVAFQCAIALAASGAFSLLHAGEEFALDLFGGFIGGAILGTAAWAAMELIRRHGIDSPTLHVTLELLIPFVIYSAAKQLHIGAVIAVVAAGLIMALLPHRHSIESAQQRLQSASVWETIEFILNGIIFVLLGMQLPRLLQPMGGIEDPVMVFAAMIMILIVLEAVRFLWILGMDILHYRHAKHSVSRLFHADELKSTLAMAFAGPKGGITLSLMLTMPATLASGDATVLRMTVITIASGVILGTLLLANFGVPLLVPHKREAKRIRERVNLEVQIIERTLASVKEDAPFTGTVHLDPAAEGTSNINAEPTDGNASQSIGGTASEIDEPATIIVMKRYADQLEDLIPHASAEVAASAQAAIDEVNDLYGAINEIAAQMQGFDDESDASDIDDEDDGDANDRSSLTERFHSLRRTYDAVEDIQAQALARELEFIKAMKKDGRLTPDHAKELRNNVYIQQLVL